MPDIINIHSNKKEIEIQRDGVKVGSIYFDPTDMSIIQRLKDVRSKLPELDPSIDKTNVDAMLAEAGKIDTELRAAIDYAFDYPCSDVVFGAGYSFTTCKGVSALEQFLDGAIKYISKEMATESKAAQKRQDKYLAKYAK